ncbi:MAG: hypothetical protein IPL79_08065 [Myxococcales bacterium]|nr:hypothetical protein [Myxococcales bacterium]
MIQEFLRRHFWVVTAFTVLTCAYFAARMTGSLVAAKYLADPKASPKLAVIIEPEAPAVRSKDGGSIVARHMFCSACSPVETAAAGPGGETSLPLVLIATNVGSVPEYSFATVLNTATLHQGFYAVGDTIPGAGPIDHIYYKYLEFQNAGRVEKLMLLSDAAPASTPIVSAAVTAPPADDLAAALDQGVKKINDSTYEISRALVDQILANPFGLQKDAKVQPAVVKGKPVGLRLYSVKPSGVYGKIGLVSGDVINSVNGFDLTSAEQGLEAYSKLKQATNLELVITRRGQSVTMRYSIR